MGRIERIDPSRIRRERSLLRREREEGRLSDRGCSDDCSSGGGEARIPCPARENGLKEG